MTIPEWLRTTGKRYCNCDDIHLTVVVKELPKKKIRSRNAFTNLALNVLIGPEYCKKPVLVYIAQCSACWKHYFSSNKRKDLKQMIKDSGIPESIERVKIASRGEENERNA